MRILHFCMQAPFTEGYSYQDNLLPEYQHKHGYDVRIVTTTKTRGSNGQYRYTTPGQSVMNNGVELVRLEVKSKIRNAAGIYCGMIQQMKDFRPDMIFIHGLCSFIPASAIKYKKRCAESVCIVADNHQDTGTTRIDDLPSYMLLFLQKLCWKSWIKQVDKVYGTTSWRVTYAHDHYGIPYEKTDVLLMGIDEDAIPADKVGLRRRYRSDLHIPQDAFVFITGGKIDGNKHILEAMRAFTDGRFTNTYFLIFGSVSDEIKTDFFRLVNDNDSILYVGYQPSAMIKNYFIASDFGIFPGRHSVLWEEAIGCSLPCLFHRYEAKDHTEICDNCICIKDTDAESIRPVMEKVLTDKDYYQQMKTNAEKAAVEFSYHTIAEKSVEVCKGEQDVRY